MWLKFVWAEGELTIGPGATSHHINLLQQLGFLLPRQGLAPPQNWVGGEFSTDDFHGPEYDKISLSPSYQHGVFPEPAELKYMIQHELGRTAREDHYAEIASRLAATVEDTEPKNNFSFLTDPHDALYSCAWEGKEMKRECNSALKSHVLEAINADDRFVHADDWIYFTVYGSGASYNWDEDGDFDVQMWVDVAKYNEQHQNAPMSSDDLLAEVRRILGPVNFPSFADLGLDTDECAGKMLVQYYAKPGTGAADENLAQKPYACYDMEEDKWLVPPKPITPKFYGQMFVQITSKAEEIARQAEALLGELERNTVNWQFWTALYKKYRDDDFRREISKSQDDATRDREAVHSLFLGVFGGRRDAYNPEGKGIEDERDLTQKLLEVWGVFQNLKHFGRAPLPWEEQEMPEAPKKSAQLHNVVMVDTSFWQHDEDHAGSPFFYDPWSGNLYLATSGGTHSLLFNIMMDNEIGPIEEHPDDLLGGWVEPNGVVEFKYHTEWRPDQMQFVCELIKQHGEEMTEPKESRLKIVDITKHNIVEDEDHAEPPFFYDPLENNVYLANDAGFHSNLWMAMLEEGLVTRETNLVGGWYENGKPIFDYDWKPEWREEAYAQLHPQNPSVNSFRLGRLQGLPENAMGPHNEIKNIARSYMRQAGLPYSPPQTYQKVDPTRAKQIATLYDQMQHNPNDSKVRASYAAMIAETKAQYDHLQAHGYQFEFYPHGVDPYPKGPRQAIEDLHQNRHMYVYPTYAGYGQGDDDGLGDHDHPLLEHSGEEWNGQPVTHNDIFRAVHDAFGHAKEGVGFRHDGEENAWRQHSAMYSELARPAMTSETRGQNSWVNFGPHGEANQSANQADTVYAEQKAGLLPDWVTHDGANDRTSRYAAYDYLPMEIDSYAFYNGQPVRIIGLSQYGHRTLYKFVSAEGAGGHLMADWGENLQPMPDMIGYPIHNDPRMSKTAAWQDIMEKAQRLRDSGQVQIASNGKKHVEGTVVGDTGTYDTEFDRMDPNSGAITTWNCSCPWGQVSWGRTRRWKKFNGRPCAHLLAMYWTSLQQPVTDDSEIADSGIQQGQPPIPNVPEAPPGPQAPGGHNPMPPGLSPPPAVEPQMPAPVPISVPKPADHPGTVSFPGALSKVAQYAGGDIVRARIPLYGEDRDGKPYVVPQNMAGEVIFSDPQETICIFPLPQNGPLKPFLIRVVCDTDEVYPDPKGRPFVGHESNVQLYKMRDYAIDGRLYTYHGLVWPGTFEAPKVWEGDPDFEHLFDDKETRTYLRLTSDQWRELVEEGRVVPVPGSGFGQSHDEWMDDKIRQAPEDAAEHWPNTFPVKWEYEA